jgi:hypothetical protein
LVGLKEPPPQNLRRWSPGHKHETPRQGEVEYKVEMLPREGEQEPNALFRKGELNVLPQG